MTVEERTAGTGSSPLSGVPAGTTTRFVLLIAAVLATGSFVFITIWNSVPANASRLSTTLISCTRARVADPDAHLPFTSVENANLFYAAQLRWRACVLPTYLDEAAWAGYGSAIILGVAGVLYLVHPWWIRRRRRSKPLLAKDDPELARYLGGLCADLGLPPPRWLVAPSPTTSGLTFGLPGRRYVQLNAGLITRYTTNRAEFRAVVLHELAHLRNRDVDKTYLTIAIWWAFAGCALLPMAALTIQPRLLYRPEVWTWSGVGGSLPRTLYVVAALAFLGGLVYLTRNAILRVRETQADAVAAGYEPDALRALVDRLRPARGPRWWPALGTHPTRAQRRAAINDPATLLRAGLWELAGIGVAAAVFGSNFDFLLNVLFVRNPLMGRAPLGLLVGALMIGMLMVELWRASAADPSRPWSPRTWLGAPAALVAGFVAGGFVSLQSALTEPYTELSTLGLVTLVLLVGVLLITVWGLSTTRAVLTGAGHPRLVMTIVVISAVIATAPWLAAWFTLRDIGIAWQPELGEPPDPGGAIGWYRLLANWAGLHLPFVFSYAIENPLTLPGLTLLWLVPVLVLVRRSATGDRPAKVGFAAVVGLSGGLLAIAASIGLPVAAKATLPVAVRDLSESAVTVNSVTFPVVFDSTYVAVTVLIQVAVAVVVVSRPGRCRPALALFAMSLCAAVATAAQVWVGRSVAACVDLIETHPDRCLVRETDFPYLTMVMHEISVRGVLFAIPVIALSAAIAGWLRRRPGTTEPAVTVRQRAAAVAIVTLTGVLLAANLTVAALAVRHNYGFWTNTLGS